MKKLLLLAFAVLILAACQNDDNPTVLTEIGEWKLEQLTPVRSTEVITAAELDFTETYHFRENGTFSKFSTRAEMELSGTYETVPVDPDDRFDPMLVRQLILTFDSDQYEAILDREEGSNRAYVDLYIYGVDNFEVLGLRNDNSLSNGGHRSHGDFLVYTRK
ncbi:lipoprotein [Litoribacter alkaliphilus]|uniref:Lipoprotein n=1 Tax=Litoribacter ruber TaxID=702568 RepID=A0AAP2CF66_9BACT|nr:membrane lipoprotein lipid attachment site-containing protein [Litoribacter alkaliphilus]MBS9523468.1 lipoprotein [Litoribacter alkaliphilus]